MFETMMVRINALGNEKVRLFLLALYNKMLKIRDHVEWLRKYNSSVDMTPANNHITDAAEMLEVKLEHAEMGARWLEATGFNSTLAGAEEVAETLVREHLTGQLNKLALVRGGLRREVREKFLTAVAVLYTERRFKEGRNLLLEGVHAVRVDPDFNEVVRRLVSEDEPKSEPEPVTVNPAQVLQDIARAEKAKRQERRERKLMSHRPSHHGGRFYSEDMPSPVVTKSFTNVVDLNDIREQNARVAAHIAAKKNKNNGKKAESKKRDEKKSRKAFAQARA